ncbi:hypothetical protein ABTN43_19250, partial [Acinetobacter baumannii]
RSAAAAAAAADDDGGEGGGAAARRLSDYILGQIVKVWAFDYRSPRYRDAAITLDVMMNADGTLTSPLGKNDPWSPRQMVYNYDRLGPDERL